ncbi:AraC family transcriptional regulator [Celeribacter sp.]|uniref:AraC family transcriptional regulator n=1 Tax=Celeribacter sp. TaxID=1890673 RepID=UPI003A93F8D6
MDDGENPAIFQADGSEYTADACVDYRNAIERGDLRGGAWVRGQYPGKHLKNNVLDGVRAIGYWDCDRDQDWYVKPHFNEGIEISMVLNGTVGFETGGRYETLTRGRLALTSPWQKHSIGGPYVSASRKVFIILDVGVRRPNSAWVWPDWILASDTEKQTLAQQILHNQSPVRLGTPEMIFAMEKIYDLLILDEMEKNASAMGIYVNLVFKGLSEILDYQPESEFVPDEKHMTIEVFAKGLRQHLSHDWRLEDMAKQCAMSRSQFCAIFKEVTNKTPIEYLNELRLESAAQQLRDATTKPITDIGFEAGFGSSQYFSRKFSEYYGMSPRTYRHQVAAT